MNKTHVDQGALEFLIKKFNLKSMLDVGCGPGGMITLAQQLGLDATGIDGDPALQKLNPNIFLHDYNDGPVGNVREVELIWSCEFLEHVEEEYLSSVMDTFTHGKYLIMTHALPGETGGHHHVNLKSEDWWCGYLAANHFIFDVETTKQVREHSTMAKGFMKKTGKFFINENYIL